MNPIIIPEQRARKALARYQITSNPIEYADGSTERVDFYYKSDRLFGWRVHRGLIRHTEHVPTESELRSALADLLKSENPSWRYLAARNLDMLDSDRRLLLPSKERGRPIENSERDQQIVRWVAWLDALKIPKRWDDLARHFGISEPRIKQIKSERKTSIMFETADTSAALRNLLDRSQRDAEKFITPMGSVHIVMKKDS